MNTYEEKKQMKIERFKELAEKNRAKSDSYYRGAKAIGDMIPFGQPILVGHHSEGRHRRDIKRIDSGMRNSIECDKKAAYYEGRAASAESNNAIFSDDPEAVTKLKEKIAKAEKTQEIMKAGNSIVRKILKKGTPYDPELLKNLGELTGSKSPETLLEPDFCGRTGFAGYMLTNNNANINRMKKRLIELEAKTDQETKSYMIGQVEVVENVEENRVQILFPGKPAPEMRAKLKSRGFRWSPFNKAWQRHLNNAGRDAVKDVLKDKPTIQE